MKQSLVKLRPEVELPEEEKRSDESRLNARIEGLGKRNRQPIFARFHSGNQRNRSLTRVNLSDLNFATRIENLELVGSPRNDRDTSPLHVANRRRGGGSSIVDGQ